MPEVLQAAVDQYSETQRLSLLARDAAAQMRVDPSAINDTWAAALPRVLRVTVAGQQNLASGADDYVSAVLAEQNLLDDRMGTLNAAALVGVAGDGRSLDSLLDQPRIGALVAIRDGASPVLAVEQAINSAATMARTAVQDAGRGAEAVATGTRVKTGYVRMLNPPSCARCVILAGRYYRFNAGFQRHMNCDCVHIPTSENVAGDLTTNPFSYFDSLSAADQDTAFGKAGAQAVRDGADPAQVVNARRGMSVAQSGIVTTTEGVTKRGAAYRTLLSPEDRARFDANRRKFRPSRTPVRLMPESIYALASDRAEAVALLRKNGYLL